MGRDYPNDSIAENGQNHETSPGDLRRIAVTQTPVKNHQLTLMWKALTNNNNNDNKNPFIQEISSTLYVSRKGGRGLTIIEYYTDTSIQGFEDNIRKTKKD